MIGWQHNPEFHPDCNEADFAETQGPESIMVIWLPDSNEWESVGLNEYSEAMDDFHPNTKATMFDYDELDDLLAALREEFPDIKVFTPTDPEAWRMTRDDDLWIKNCSSLEYHCLSQLFARALQARTRRGE